MTAAAACLITVAQYTLMAGVICKRHAVSAILRETGVKVEQVAFVGDDEFDLEVRPVVGLFFAPRDAQPEVRSSSDVVLDARGGQGAVREAAELILHAKKLEWETILEWPLDASPVTISIGRASARTLRLALSLLDAFLRRGIPCLCTEANTHTESLDAGRCGAVDPASVLTLSLLGGERILLRAVDTAFGGGAVILDKEHTRYAEIDNIADVVSHSAWSHVYHRNPLLRTIKKEHAFTKTGDRARIEPEVEWQHAMSQRSCTRNVLPVFYGMAALGAYSTYWTGRIFGHSLREIVTDDSLLGVIGLPTLLESFTTFLTRTLRDFYCGARMVFSAVYAWDFYEAKVLQRSKMIEARFGESHYMFIRRAYSCGFPDDGAVLVPPVGILRRLRIGVSSRALMRLAAVTMIHGDLHFGNIMYGADSLNGSPPRLYIVDGKNQRFPGMPPAYGDVAYDVGKLYQSTEGCIDSVITAAANTTLVKAPR